MAGVITLKLLQIIDYELASVDPHQYTFDDGVWLIDKQLISNPGKES
jgi:hypothetical protein